MIYTYESCSRELDRLEQRIALVRQQGHTERALFLEGQKDGMAKLLNSLPKEDEKIVKKAQP